MANFNYTVDTKPMADEMRSVSRHVNATTGAVVAMQTAVIIAEEKAADCCSQGSPLPSDDRHARF